MSPKLAVNNKHNKRMPVKRIKHPSRKKWSLCVSPDSTDLAVRVPWADFKRMKQLLCRPPGEPPWPVKWDQKHWLGRAGHQGMQWPPCGWSLCWFPGAARTNYKLGGFYQWKLILPGFGGQKSEIKVSGGSRSLQRLKGSILPHLFQLLVPQVLLSLWPRPSHLCLCGLRSLCVSASVSCLL